MEKAAATPRALAGCRGRADRPATDLNAEEEKQRFTAGRVRSIDVVLGIYSVLVLGDQTNETSPRNRAICSRSTHSLPLPHTQLTDRCVAATQSTCQTPTLALHLPLACCRLHVQRGRSLLPALPTLKA